MACLNNREVHRATTWHAKRRVDVRDITGLIAETCGHVRKKLLKQERVLNTMIKFIFPNAYSGGNTEIELKINGLKKKKKNYRRIWC